MRADGLEDAPVGSRVADALEDALCSGRAPEIPRRFAAALAADATSSGVMSPNRRS
jgi:hypothetical protein